MNPFKQNRLAYIEDLQEEMAANALRGWTNISGKIDRKGLMCRNACFVSSEPPRRIRIFKGSSCTNNGDSKNIWFHKDLDLVFFFEDNELKPEKVGPVLSWVASHWPKLQHMQSIEIKDILDEVL